MRIAVYEGANRVPEHAWTGIAPPDFFFSLEFLRVMEASRVENARYRYVALYHDDRPAGLAVLTRFTLKLDLLARDARIRVLRTMVPRLLDVPIVCCGIPASYGQHHLHVTRSDLAAQAVRAVHDAMEAWAAETDSPMLCWKEWHSGHAAFAAIAEQGYVALPTLPEHQMRDLPASVDSFLASMRSPYRRKYRTAASLMRGPGPTWSSTTLQLDDLPFTDSEAQWFYRGYASVMSRTEVKLETYPVDFFYNLANSRLDVRILRLTDRRTGDRVAALVLPGSDVLTFMLTSKERAHYRDALYSRLLQCIILYAVRSGFREVRLGQTSGYAKGSLGAESLPLHSFIRLRKPWQHALLNRFGSLLFPDTIAPRFHVFRDARSHIPDGPEVTHA